MLYQVAIIRKPTQEETNNGQLETILVQPTFVVAVDEQRAALSRGSQKRSGNQ